MCSLCLIYVLIFLEIHGAPLCFTLQTIHVYCFHMPQGSSIHIELPIMGTPIMRRSKKGKKKS